MTIHSRKKRSHFFEYLIINIFVFVGIGLLSFFLFNVSIFNQFTQAFKDFTITDMYYSNIKNYNKIYDSSLVLVNVQKKSREEIAYLITRLEESKPKVVGLDIIFKKGENDTANNALLKQTLSSYSNIVYPYIASFDNSTEETRNDPYFNINSTSFVNTSGENKEFATTRYFYPAKNKIPAFTTAVMNMYDSSRGASLFKRNNEKTEIRYYGNVQNFKNYNADELFSPGFDINILKGKIVLLGYLGITNTENKMDEDRFFTPLNPRLSGRSFPDMYGMVIHANILRMELDNDFIYSFPTWLNWLLAFLLSWIILPLFIKWWVHKAVWFHLFSMLLQLTVSILFVFITIWLYAYANVKIESSSVLVAVLLLGDFILFYDSIVLYLKRKLKWNFHSKFFEGAH